MMAAEDWRTSMNLMEYLPIGKPYVEVMVGRSAQRDTEELAGIGMHALGLVREQIRGDAGSSELVAVELYVGGGDDWRVVGSVHGSLRDYLRVKGRLVPESWSICLTVECGGVEVGDSGEIKKQMARLLEMRLLGVWGRIERIKRFTAEIPLD